MPNPLSPLRRILGGADQDEVAPADPAAAASLPRSAQSSASGRPPRMAQGPPTVASPDSGRSSGQDPAAPDAGGAIYLVLRRMRAPLIVLVLVFSISVIGLTLIPGTQPDGGSQAMSFFHALYFMAYTATTIGFGEIPHPLSTAQRAWVTFAIFWSVIGWAYAIGSLLSLLQDRGFRREIARQSFQRKVRRIPGSFLILVGYGEAGTIVARDLDRRGKRIVVVDHSEERIEALHLAGLRAEIPALATDTRHGSTLVLAGLQHPRCAGVLALTDDDEANMAAVQASYLIRPDLPVIARAHSRKTAELMRAFGTPTVVDPFDSFGDRLRVLLRTPALAQLFDWLVSPPGHPVPPRTQPPKSGRWVVIGHSRITVEVAADLHKAQVPFVVIDPQGAPAENPGPQDHQYRELMATAVGLIAAADRETENANYIHAAKRANPGLFVVARQESVAEARFVAALAPDLLLVPGAVVAREVLERLANPAVWDFLNAAKGESEAWAAAALERLIEESGEGSPDVWQVRIDESQTPALTTRLAATSVRLGDLKRSPFARDRLLPIVPLMLERRPPALAQAHAASRRQLMPGDEVELEVGDVLLVAGGRGAKRGWDLMLVQDEALDYALPGRYGQPAWWARRLPHRDWWEH